MPEVRRLHLRVLYTINSSSYILARSPVLVPITPVPGGSKKTEPYGAVSFKTCLEAICRSSPELMQDCSRDFSVYVLDPLESNATLGPMDISNPSDGQSMNSTTNSSAHTRGVAVGMGFMSLGLSAEDQEPVTVVGTLSKTGAGQAALEVIIALRETAQTGQSRSSSSSVSWNATQHRGPAQSLFAPHASCQNSATTTPETLATIASIQSRTKAKNKPKKLPRVSSTPMTESDKLLSADTYIGPVKKKGRPKGAINNETRVKVEDMAPSQLLSGLGTAICVGTSTTTTIQSMPTTNSPPTQMVDSSFSSQSGGPDLSTLALLFSASRNDATQNAFLLNALGLIDSPTSQGGSQPSVNTTLVHALRQLLDNAHVKAQSGPTPTTAFSPPTSQPSTHSSLTPSPNDDDIVPLDKENINPATFQQRAEREYEQAKLGTNSQANMTPTTLGSDRPVPQNRGLGARSIENSPPKAHPLPTVPSTYTNSLLRKRTLDDCMEERDNKRNRNHRNKGKEKDRFDKRELSRFHFSQQQSLRHYPYVLASTAPRPASGMNSYYRSPVEPWTSPPRTPRQECLNTQPQLSDMGGNSRNCPIIIPDSPQPQRVSASSPIKPSNAPKKPYVVPTWARTNTATQPRLSEEAQRAAVEAEGKRKEEKRANRRRTNAAAQERSRQRGRIINVENEDAPNSDPTRPPECHEWMRPPLPVLPQSDLPPIIASSDTGLNLFPPSAQRARSPSPKRKSRLPPPVTPKRSSKFAPSTPGMTAYDDDSLFTPMSIARRSTGSPLFSPGMFGSPLARKNAIVTSPTAHRSISRRSGSESSMTITKANESSEDTLIKLKKSPTPDEQGESQNDLDCPPSSLPIASSDIDTDETAADYPTNTQDRDGVDDEDDEDMPPRIQHWIGLPPSSPPPPSSPGLMPIDDDADIPCDGGDSGVDEELPVASEAEYEPHEVLNMTGSDRDPGPADADDSGIPLPNVAIINVDAEREEELAFLEQYTTTGGMDGLSDGLHAFQGTPHSDPSLAGGDPNSLFPGGLDNMDLKGFWEAFKPANTDAPEPGAAFDFSALEYLTSLDVPPQPVDHKKLAADLQALLSGCVV